MILKKKQVRNGDIEVFFELREDDSPIWLEDKTKPMYRIYVYVKNQNQEMAWYQRRMDKKMNTVHFHSFIKKFLENPNYREQFAWIGSWDGVISFPPSEEVHPECKKQITYINQSDSLRFKDFLNLKTFGLDKYSSMKMEKLESIIPVDQQTIIKSHFQNNRHILMAYRWMARGLKTEQAIRKVKTDLEIKQNKIKQ